jgi:hypothetical protein
VRKRSVARNHPNRNSANLGGSASGNTLQEDLLKLINPEYEDLHQENNGGQQVNKSRVRKLPK